MAFRCDITHIFVKFFSNLIACKKITDRFKIQVEWTNLANTTQKFGEYYAYFTFSDFNTRS